MNQTADKIRVLLVDDHPIIRHGLTQLINQEADFSICGEVEDGPQVLPAVDALHPDIVLLDITLKTVSGINVLQEVRARYPDLPVLMLTMHDEARFAERSLRAGASGYVIKQDPPENLISALRTVLSGEIYMSGAMTSKMFRKLTAARPDHELVPEEQLSARELEIFRLIGQGKGTREIAELLAVSVKTVDAHRANIKRKLDLRSGTKLVQRAITWSLRDVHQ